MKRSNLFITATGISFAFCVTSIAYADTPFLRQEQLQEQKIQHAISASRSTAQLTKPIAFEQAVEVDPSMQDLSSTAFFVRESVVDDNLEKFSFLEDMMASTRWMGCSRGNIGRTCSCLDKIFIEGEQVK